ncbi:hypothetical protein Q4520_17665 [Alteromonas sp. 1_MG-2023]|uniref:hypothetical protein n=1 Tax=Alteromonas sp. 1_MG-2023 TaxID=3062669 RepID=UPI0026E226B2|nr:hypothetical protein [Alteromonas sp. 1_MG-2023]MDO6477252.1 hypothetical protein [Alteromonas sp. 1_MG-2023]
MMENTAFYLFLNTTITRIGAVLLLIFGVQIFIGFYRYNLKLAALYDARADVLELLDESSLSNIQSVVEALSPDNIEIGKSPAAPINDVAKLIDIVAKINKNS